jgi:methionyl aminopeptidase
MTREEVLEKVRYYKTLGYKVPQEKYIKTPEQIEGIREAGRVNTLVLDYVAERIRAGISTQEIDDWVTEVTAANNGSSEFFHNETSFRRVTLIVPQICLKG